MISTTIKSLLPYFFKRSQAGPPLRALLYITNRCNLECVSCDSWKRGDHDLEMTTEEIYEVIDQLGNAGVTSIYLFGGEPTIQKDINGIILRCKQNGLYTEMVTNGATLNTQEKAEALVKTKIDKICVSLDGLENTHDELRGQKGSFGRAITSIDQITLARERLGSSTPLLEVGHTISRPNYSEIKDLVSYLNGKKLFEIKLRHMGVFSPDDIEDLNKKMSTIGVDFPPLFSTGEEILLNPEEILSLRRILTGIEKDHKENRMDYIPHVEPSIYFVDDLRKGREVKACLHLWTQIAINAFGQMVPCIWYDGVNLGDVKNGKLMQVWNAEKARYFRDNYLKLSACRKCCYFYLTFFENLKRALQVPLFPFKKMMKLSK